MRNITWLLPCCLGIGTVSLASDLNQGVNLAALQDWRIVVAEDAPPSERYAAQELQQFLEQSTGRHLDLVAHAREAGQNIFVGASQPMRSSPVGFAVDGFGGEDLRIVIKGNNIAIAGGQPRGTLYGVYTFLEDYLGVRFVTADHTHVPKVGAWRVVGPVDRFYHPPLEFRWSFYGETSANPAFAARRRVNTISDDPKLGGKTGTALIGHSFGHQIPWSKYGKEHPEYYALIDGKRPSEIGDDWSQVQPCLTNPDVLRIVTEAVLKDLKANSARSNIVVGQNDNDKYCRCPQCAAIDEREGTPMGSLLTFVNAVADEVAKHYPNIKVGTLSYWYTRKPPAQLKPRPNVQIQLCSIECCLLHPIDDPDCSKNRAFCADMAGWGKICDNVSVWNYNTNFSNYLLPLPNLRVIEPNVRYFVANQAKGIFMQAAGNTTGAELCDLRNYLISGLLWDPNRDGRTLVDEFLTLHYGRAAQPIRAWIEQNHEKARKSNVHQNCYGPLAAYGLDQATARSGMRAFERAMQLADDAVTRARVEKASICAIRAAVEPVWNIPEGSTADPALAAKTRPLFKKLFELCEKYKVGRPAEVVSFEQVKARYKKALGIPDDADF